MLPMAFIVRIMWLEYQKGRNAKWYLVTRPPSTAVIHPDDPSWLPTVRRVTVVHVHRWASEARTAELLPVT